MQISVSSTMTYYVYPGSAPPSSPCGGQLATGTANPTTNPQSVSVASGLPCSLLLVDASNNCFAISGLTAESIVKLLISGS